MAASDAAADVVDTVAFDEDVGVGVVGLVDGDSVVVGPGDEMGIGVPGYTSGYTQMMFLPWLV